MDGDDNRELLSQDLESGLVCVRTCLKVLLTFNHFTRYKDIQLCCASHKLSMSMSHKLSLHKYHYKNDIFQNDHTSDNTECIFLFTYRLLL